MKKRVAAICLLSTFSVHGYLQYFHTQLIAGKQITDFSGQDVRGLQFSSIPGLVLKGANFHNVRGQMCVQTDKNARAFGQVCDPNLKTDFSGMDVSGANLSSSNFSQALFVKTNLAGADLTHSTFKFVDFSGAHFQGAQIGTTDFTGANLTGAIGFESVVQTDSQCIFTCATMPDGTVCIPGMKEWKTKDASGKEVTVLCNCPDVKKIKTDPKKYCTSQEFVRSLNLSAVMANVPQQDTGTQNTQSATVPAPAQTEKKTTVKK